MSVNSKNTSAARIRLYFTSAPHVSACINASALTLQTLREPHGSYPGNPLIAEPLYLTKYIERMGTGIHDMIERCSEAGLAEPEFKLAYGFVTVIRRRPVEGF
jgi:predicted HTH transcriptional regulator